MKKQKNSIGKVASRCENEKFLIFLGILFLILSISQSAIAGTEHNVAGWAWSENIGWISFNCYNDYNGDGILENHCTSSNYGVNLDLSTGLLSGYAWAGGGEAGGNATATIGWISFNTSSLVGCPDGNCFARVNTTTGEVSGWARACSVFQSGCSGATSTNTGGWDGWIHLSGTTTEGTHYGVTLNLSTREFEGWAAGWDDTKEEAVIGWISFNCKNLNVCSTSTYKVFLINQPPTANNLSVDAQSSDVICGETEGSRAKFSWNFVDPDPGDSQSAYRIQIDDDSNFSSPEVDTRKILSSSQTFLLSPPYSLLNWGTTYYWRLMVWDNHDATSTWINGPSFTTPSHPYPAIDFSWKPQRPAIGQAVQFTDQSNCYDTAGTTTCSNSTGDSFFWTFQNGNPASSTKQNPTTTFSSVGPNLVTLKVTDSSGYWCENSTTVASTYPLPFWKEIPPFYYLEKFLASLFSKIRLF